MDSIQIEIIWAFLGDLVKKSFLNTTEDICNCILFQDSVLISAKM